MRKSDRFEDCNILFRITPISHMKMTNLNFDQLLLELVQYNIHPGNQSQDGLCKGRGNDPTVMSGTVEYFFHPSFHLHLPQL